MPRRNCHVVLLLVVLFAVLSDLSKSCSPIGPTAGAVVAVVFEMRHPEAVHPLRRKPSELAQPCPGPKVTLPVKEYGLVAVTVLRYALDEPFAPTGASKPFDGLFLLHRDLLHEPGRAAESHGDSLRPALVVDLWFNWRYGSSRSLARCRSPTKKAGKGRPANVR